MCAAGNIACQLKLWSRKEQQQMEELIQKTGLPTKLSKKLSRPQVQKALFRDKKVMAGKLRFILPKKIGKVVAKTLTPKQALEGLNYIM